jgi:multidrug transporter EmrE-like cation transporter
MKLIAALIATMASIIIVIIIKYSGIFNNPLAGFGVATVIWVSIFKFVNKNSENKKL